MAVKRDVPVPVTEVVQFVRAGQIRAVRHSESGLTFVTLIEAELRSDAFDLNLAPRVVVSPDAAGDHMRPGVLIARPGGVGQAALTGPAQLITENDWLWVEP